MEHFKVYILQSLKDNKHYTGYTRNLEKRLLNHNQGGVESTRNRRPLKLIYTENFTSAIEARKREKFLKSGVGREELKKILSNIAAPWPSG